MSPRRKSKPKRRKPKRKTGAGIINDIINKLPVELHAPGYHFLGPGTRYEDRVSGDFGKSRDKKDILNSEPINELDAAAKEHDAAYTTHRDTAGRSASDRVLRQKAQQIYKDNTKDFRQRAFAYLTDKIFHAKQLLGAGVKPRKGRQRVRYN